MTLPEERERIDREFDLEWKHTGKAETESCLDSIVPERSQGRDEGKLIQG
jgi:hypothetical protein